MIQKLDCEFKARPYSGAPDAYQVTRKFVVTYDDANPQHKAKVLELAVRAANVAIKTRLIAGLQLKKGEKFSGDAAAWKQYIGAAQGKLSILDLFGKIERPVTADDISAHLAAEKTILQIMAAKKITRLAAIEKYNDMAENMGLSLFVETGTSESSGEEEDEN